MNVNPNFLNSVEKKQIAVALIKRYIDDKMPKAANVEATSLVIDLILDDCVVFESAKHRPIDHIKVNLELAY